MANQIRLPAIPISGRVCAMAAVGLGAAAAWSWAAGVAQLLTVGPHAAMGPLAALLLLLLSLAVLQLFRRPEASLTRRLGRWIAALAAGAGLAALVRFGFGWESPLEEWLQRMLLATWESEPRAIGPMTAAGFLTAAGSLLVQLHPLGNSRAGLQSGRALAVGTALIGAVGLTSAALGLVHHGLEQLPAAMPVHAALSFLLLGHALGCLQVRPGPGSNSNLPRSTGPAAMPFMVTTLMTLLLSSLTAGYLRRGQAHEREMARRLLEAVGKLKESQILEWRKERLNDARFFSQADFAANDVAACLSDPESSEAQARLARWLHLLKGGNRYSLVALFDTNGTVRLTLPAHPLPAASIPSRDLTKVLETGELVMSDFYRSAQDGAPRLDIAFPVGGASSSRAAPSASPAPPGGVVLLRLDPTQFLYPLLQSWPVPSRTAETVIFRREEQEIVFLNVLRHRTNAPPLTLRFPLTAASDLPAVKAMFGSLGSIDGRDYRGVPVLTEVRAIPGTPWFLASKMDREEVEAPFLSLAWVTLLLTASLGVGVALVTGFACKRHEANQAKRELAAERRRRELAERVEHLMRHANDAILLADEGNRILEANDRALELYGCTLPELQAMSLSDLTGPQSPDPDWSQAGRAAQAARTVCQARHRRPDGTTFPVEISASLVQIGGDRYRLCILRDMAQRQAQEREIDRLNRLYATLSQVNQSIVRVRSRQELFEEVCRITVGHGIFKAAWIGCVDGETKAVKPVAYVGALPAWANQISVFASDRPEGRGAVGTCIREGQACILNDFIHAPDAAPWREAALAHGVRSVAAFPILFQEQVWGAFTVYADEPGVFGEQEVALLKETSLDLSFALTHLHQEEMRLKAAAELQTSERHFRSLFENMLNGLAYCQMVGGGNEPLDFVYLKVNPAFEKLTELKGVVGQRLSEVIPGLREQDPELLEIYARVARTGQPEQFERYVRALDKWFSVSAYCPSPGHFVAVFDVITARKKAEEELWQRLELRNQLARTAETVPGMIYTLRQRPDGSMCIPFASAALDRIFGLTLHSVAHDAAAAFALIHPEDLEHVRSTIAESAQTLSPWRTEFRVRHTRRGELWVEGHAVPQPEADGGILWHGFIQDITGRKRLEAQFRQAQKMEAIGQLAGGVAHDFNNILAATMMQLGLLQQRSDLDSELQEALADLVRQSERAAGLTRQLLLFSRRSVMQVRALDLNEIVEQLLKMLRRIIGEEISLEWQAKSLLPAVAGDAGMLEQVLMNLVVNARDAMPQGGRITIATDLVEVDQATPHADPEMRPGRFVRLTVADTGCGMEESLLKRIFEPFFTTKGAGKGTGLGLATVYGIAKQHQGWVTVESTVGKGSTFRVFLPADPAAAPDQVAAPGASPPPRGQESILLVEDDQAVRNTTRGLLRHWGYRVLDAPNGPDALRLFEEYDREFSLLLTDMVMPNGWNGLQLAERLRTSKPDLRVIISSGYSADLLQPARWADQGFVFLPKPCPPALLARALRDALDGTELTAPKR